MLSRAVARAICTFGLIGSLSLSVAAQQTDYVLGPEDVFTITIWGQGGVSDRFTIESDGMFTFPILGRVTAGGLTVRQLQDDLIRRLQGDYYKNPRVAVTVENYRSQRIFIVGEVKSPGTYGLTRPMTLVEALTLAGSTTPNAGGVALIRRRTAGVPSKNPLTEMSEDVTEIRADLTALRDGVLAPNPVLRDGDTILIPRTLPVYVYGHVGRQGEYIIGKEATLRQVLSLAGGVSQRGSTGRIKVMRLVDGIEQEIKADLDDRVRPGDTIIVPERYF